MSFSPSVCAQVRRQLPHQVEPGNGAGTFKNVSMKALNLWAFMRGFEISLNRIETQNPCPSNLWGHGFVIMHTAVAASGHSPQHGSCRKWTQSATRQLLAAGTAHPTQFLQLEYMAAKTSFRGGHSDRPPRTSAVATACRLSLLAEQRAIAGKFFARGLFE